MSEDEARAELATLAGHEGTICRAIVKAGDSGQSELATWCLSSPGPDWIRVAWYRSVAVLRLPLNVRQAARLN